MGIFSEALEPIKAERQRQKEEKERKRKARAEQGSFGERALAFIKVWCLRLFYTFFMFMGMYLLILCGTLFVCLLYTSPSPRDRTRSRMPSSA